MRRPYQAQEKDQITGAHAKTSAPTSHTHNSGLHNTTSFSPTKERRTSLSNLDTQWKTTAAFRGCLNLELVELELPPVNHRPP
jgi:hypothetical protein